MKKFYLTSAIPYVNAAPHIGHAQEFVYADTIRRFHTILGNKVFYLCGADENALKIFQAAEKAKKTPKEFTDLHNQEFLDLAQKLQVEFDAWQRGSDTKKHFPSSQKLWDLCAKKGDIYKKSYSGLYCVGCESFYTEEELDNRGECFEHPGRKLDLVSEENYFFKLSKYQGFLEDLLNKDKLRIFPTFRKNEAMSFIKKGLPDFSISRSRERARGWGIPVPDDPNQIMYVWFDALNIYQTGIGFASDEDSYNKWRPQDVMIIGKGIIRFHAVYWPAILKSAGLPLPKELFVHGYLTVDGQKMSKTLGNVVDPNKMIEKYGSDPVRFYLLKEIPSFSDGDFSERRFKEIYNSDLANGLGNLVARIAKLLEINKVKLKKNTVKNISNGVKQELEEYKFDSAIKLIWEKISGLDKFIQEKKPWEKNAEVSLEFWDKLTSGVREIAFDLQPFLPETSEKIIRQFEGPEIKSGAPLFPRIK